MEALNKSLTKIMLNIVIISLFTLGCSKKINKSTTKNVNTIANQAVKLINMPDLGCNSNIPTELSNQIKLTVYKSCKKLGLLKNMVAMVCWNPAIRHTKVLYNCEKDIEG